MLTPFVANWRLYRGNPTLASRAFFETSACALQVAFSSLVVLLAHCALGADDTPNYLLLGIWALLVGLFGYSLLNAVFLKFPDALADRVESTLQADFCNKPTLEEHENGWCLHVGGRTYQWKTAGRLERDGEVLVEGLQDASWHFVSNSRCWRLEGRLLGSPVFISAYEPAASSLITDPSGS